MPRRKLSNVERLMQSEQPISWGRALLTGVLAAILMMAFVDIFAMMGFTDFTFENYLGTLLRAEDFGSQKWTAGFVANCAVGAILGLFYAYFFEFVFGRSGTREGILAGAIHALFAGVAIFPFFNIIHLEMRTGAYRGFGFLGSGLGADTIAFLFFGHLLFGATMGTLYGPVRLQRVMSRHFEPGESGMLDDYGVITPDEDPHDRLTA